MTGIQGRRAHVMALVATEASVPGDPQGTAGDLRRLCSAAVKALPMWGAGLSLMSEAGVRGVAAASDPASERVDELQFTLGEGPCMDAFTTRRPVLEPDLDRREGALARLRRRGARRRGAGGVRVPAADRRRPARRARPVPRRAGQSDRRGARPVTDLRRRRDLDAARRSGAGAPGAAASGLDEVLEYRVELYQAQGMVMVQLGVSLVEALAVLRALRLFARPSTSPT